MTETIKTACYACHGGCAVLATMEDGRLVKVRPDPDGPLNHGRMCPKGFAGPELLYHPEHLNYPLKRAGARGEGKWARISWDEAYELITENVTRIKNAYGAKSLCVLTGTGRHLKNQVARFANVLGTPNMASSGASICFGPRLNAMLLTCGAFAVTDFYHEKAPGCVLIWGSNPINSGPDGKMMWNVRDALKKGMKLLIVDPLPTELTEKASLWLRPMPGTDGALAMGILHMLLKNEWVDRDFCGKWVYGMDELKSRCEAWPPERVQALTGVAAADIRKAAAFLWENGPVGLDWGCAVEQNPNAMGAIRAMAAIPIVLGSWDVPGGFREGEDLCPEADPMWDNCDGSIRVGHEFPACRYANVLPLLRAMRGEGDYPIRGALVFGCDPLLSIPDAKETYRDLMALDFHVCMDQFMTPSAALADLLLPAASWMELDNVYSMPAAADHALLCQRKLTRVAQRKSDGEVFMELCRRLGLCYGAGTTDELLDSQLAVMRRTHPEYKGIGLSELRALGHIEAPRTYKKHETRGRFLTPTGKIELYSTVLRDWGLDPLPGYTEYIERETDEYPLNLTTGRRQKGYFISENRQIPALRRLAPFPVTLLHRTLAAQLGIQDGDWVFIETQKGRITQKAKLADGFDPRVVNCQMGWWYPEAGAETLYGWDESNCNILTGSDGPFDPVFGSYTLRGMRCRVFPNPDGHKIEERYEAFDQNKWKMEFDLG